MKILHVVTSIQDEFAGPSYSVPSLCNALQNNGCDVTLYVLGDIPKNKKFNFTIRNFKRDTFPTKKIANLLGTSNDMYKELDKEIKNYDIVHSHMLWKAPNYYPGILSKKYQKPFLIAPRGTLSQWALNYSSWKKKLILKLGQKKALDAVTCFHATALEEKEDISKFGYKDIPCTILPNGIDIPELKSKIKDKKFKRLTFLSRIHEKKGIDFLIKSWSKIQNEFSDWELFIVGPTDNNPYADNMKKFSKELKCERITFTGQIYGDEKISFLQNSDLFILPTHSENFGMVVAEALVNGVPVICSKGAPWGKLEEKNCGWWIDIGEEDLTKHLKIAMGLNEATLLEMGKNGRDWMIKEYSWDSIAKQTIEVYKWLLNQTDKPNTVI
jgi:glycosyltransferase involved in cell wall biosynthesis